MQLHGSLVSISCKEKQVRIEPPKKKPYEVQV